MLDEIVTITIPNWVQCIFVEFAILAFFIWFFLHPIFGAEFLKQPKKNQVSSCKSGDKKSINCSVCNDVGTIQGRQCSCKLAKYWRNKCSKA